MPSEKRPRSLTLSLLVSKQTLWLTHWGLSLTTEKSSLSRGLSRGCRWVTHVVEQVSLSRLLSSSTEKRLPLTLGLSRRRLVEITDLTIYGVGLLAEQALSWCVGRLCEKTLSTLDLLGWSGLLTKQARASIRI